MDSPWAMLPMAVLVAVAALVFYTLYRGHDCWYCDDIARTKSKKSGRWVCTDHLIEEELGKK